MDHAERRIEVERRFDGGLQWIRPLPAEPRDVRGQWEREFRRHRRHRSRSTDRYPLNPPIQHETDDHHIHPQRYQPSFRDVERLVGLYVATGEGRGAFLAAKEAEESDPANYERLYGDRFERRRRYDRSPSPLIDSSSSSSGHDSDPGNLPRLRPGSPGGPGPALPPDVHLRQRDEQRGHEERRGDRPWVRIPELHNDVIGPVRFHGYDNAAYLNRRIPQIDRPRPIHNGRHNVQRDVGQAPQRQQVQIIRESPQGLQDQAPPQPQDPAPPQPQDQAPQRRRHQPFVEEGSEFSDEEHEPEYGDLPWEEDDSRLQSPPQRRRYRSGLRLRGAGISERPTKTSSIGAGVLPPPKPGRIRQRKSILLYFFCTIRGKIVSSHKTERYTTYQEIGNPPQITNRAQLSDQWLVQKLHEHYSIINRRQQAALWDLVLMKTIGFATFVRFDRTNGPEDDRTNYIVTAKIPAISAEEEAVSRFKYLMKHPHESYKIMLQNLDRLAATTKRSGGFYVVEIKEGPDTFKIYILLGLLILISTGAGTAYAVIAADAGTGLSISSYILTCLSLALALVAVGEWVGLSKPDAFSFAYDIHKNQIIGAVNLGKILGSERPSSLW